MEDNHQIYEKLGTIHAEVIGINRRLDTLNGKVARHELRLNKGDVDTSAHMADYNRSTAIKDRFQGLVMQSTVTGVIVLVILILSNTGILNLEQQSANRENALEDRVEQLEAENAVLEQRTITE